MTRKDATELVEKWILENAASEGFLVELKPEHSAWLVRSAFSQRGFEATHASERNLLRILPKASGEG